MNLFDKIVTEALKNQPNFAPLRIVVEKELLHHDILRILNENNLLQNLTFIGGTCLRCCYGGIRLSEDLDFTGGSDFTRERLATMGRALVNDIQEKYGMPVHVTEPSKETLNVDTWKIKIETHPGQKSVAAQRINIDICSVPSYEKRPMMLRNPYGVDMGTDGLIIEAQSREEIYADKLLAIAFRPNRIKYRDLWDILWLHRQGIQPHFELIPAKLRDRNYTSAYFLNALKQRKEALSADPTAETGFKQEMARFLPAEQITKILGQKDLWPFILSLLDELCRMLDQMEG